MTRNTHIVTIATVTVAMLSTELASAAPAPPVDLGPNNLYGRTRSRFAPLLIPLLGWQVGISCSVFGPLSFSEAAGLRTR